MRKILVLAIFVLISAACAQAVPDDSAIETAIAQTESAKPSSTHTLEPSYTLEPTLTSTQVPSDTPEPTNTETPMPTFTFTPTPDLRVISGVPEDYILVQEDLPDKYVLRSGGSTPHLNSEILAVRGQENGKAYLEATGRIGGWIIYYDRFSDIPIAPEWIRSYIVMYENNEGPKIAKTPEYDTGYEDFENVNIELDLGDWSRARIYKERQPNGKFIVLYTIEFIYKNVWAEIMGAGWESDVQHEYLENAARAVLKKLQEAPLTEPEAP